MGLYFGKPHCMRRASLQWSGRVRWWLGHQILTLADKSNKQPLHHLPVLLFPLSGRVCCSRWAAALLFPVCLLLDAARGCGALPHGGSGLQNPQPPPLAHLPGGIRSASRCGGHLCCRQPRRLWHRNLVSVLGLGWRNIPVVLGRDQNIVDF